MFDVNPTGKGRPGEGAPPETGHGSDNRTQAGLPGVAAERRPLLLRGGRVVDGLAGPPRPSQAILIEDGRIAAIGPSAMLAADGADEIDLGGRTVLPGLIDAHAHLSSVRVPGDDRRPWQLNDDELNAALDQVAGDLVRGGVTTVRDLGGYGTSVQRLRDRIALGRVIGPRIVASGRIVSAVCPGAKAFPGMYVEATGPEMLRDAVRQVVAEGSDVIKVMATGAFTVPDEVLEPPQLTRDELRAVVEEGHRLGRRVAVHAEGLTGVRDAVAVGADTIEHAETAHRDPALLEAMAAGGIVLVPTLTAFESVAVSAFYPADLRSQSAGLSDEARLTVAAARAAGVRIVSGPDSGPQGRNGKEIARLARAGLLALEAIAAGTSVAAEACDLGDRTGRIAVGFEADLVVVDGDPLADLSLLAGEPPPWLVIRGGELLAGVGAPGSR